MDYRQHEEFQMNNLMFSSNSEDFTGRSRLDCLVHRPCPIQLSYLGYPAPTHLNCIDGWIGDQELFSTLRLSRRTCHHNFLFIDGGYMAFDPDLEYQNLNRIIQKHFALVASIMHVN